ncbi:hypothetical protein OAT67_01780 [Bacteriovoracaceae bacterium]|nr:hypothetical protein [Bacteriovoracaceae bacterium]
MNRFKSLISLSAVLLSGSAFSYGTGTVSYPLMPEKRLVSTEFIGITSTGGGIGLQGRYTQKINSRTVVDGGLGIGGGERDSRFFIGADYEIIPDYMKQPKVSLKLNLENAKEFDVRRNILSLAPTVSKGFSFWGNEAYPFVSLPIGISLDSDSKTYESVVNLSSGITGHLPFEGYRHLVATAEATIGVKDSYTGVFLGVSYPLN